MAEHGTGQAVNGTDGHAATTAWPQPNAVPARPSERPRYLWLSGRLTPWEDATVHVTAVGWPAIGAVFEGIRAYWNAGQRALYVFRMEEHLRRFRQSMKLMRMTPALTTAEVGAGLLDLLRANDVHEDTYLQPLALVMGQTRGSQAGPNTTPEIVVTSRPVPSILGAGQIGTAGVSSWTRISDNVLPPRIKALPNYANSRLATDEARRHGYDEPIFLNHGGKVAEGPGSCVFMVRDGVAVTPPTTSSVLESITRASVIDLLRDMAVPVVERDMDRTEMYIADEFFFCGTLDEIRPVSHIDGYQLGDGRVGPVTACLERRYHAVVRGDDPAFAAWLTRV